MEDQLNIAYLNQSFFLINIFVLERWLIGNYDITSKDIIFGIHHLYITNIYRQLVTDNISYV